MQNRHDVKNNESVQWNHCFLLTLNYISQEEHAQWEEKYKSHHDAKPNGTSPAHWLSV